MGVSSTRTTLDKHKIRVYNSNSQPSTRVQSYIPRRNPANSAPDKVNTATPMVNMTRYGSQCPGQWRRVLQTQTEAKA